MIAQQVTQILELATSEAQSEALHRSQVRPLLDDSAQALLTVALILSWLAAIEVIVAIGWTLRLNLLPTAPITSFFLIVGAIFLHSYANKENFRLFIRAGVIAILLCTVSLVIGALSHDFSDDGQSYHQQGILALVHGWNPFLNYQYDGKHAIWVSHYAKGPWILSASLMALSGNIELGKSINVLLAICAGMVTYAVFRSIHGASKRFAIFVAALIAVHPVTDYQFLTYYVDNQVASILVIVALLSYFLAKKKNSIVFIAFIAAIIIGANIKLPVIPFFILICGSISLYLLISRQWVLFFSLFRAQLIGFGLALFVGFNPYVTNFLIHGHPFFPAAGAKSIKILAGQATEDFLQKSRLEKFILSMFSESHSTIAENLVSPNDQIHLKLPFTVRISELKTFYKKTDVRIAGFGPLMSGAILLALIYAFFRLTVHLRIRDRNIDWLAVSLVTGLLISVLVFPESWWARFAPQFWHAIILAVALMLVFQQGKFSNFLGKLVLLVLAVNTLMVLTLSLAHQIMQEADYRAQVESLRRISFVQPIPIEIQQDSTRFRLMHEGVKFVEKMPTNCQHTDVIIATGSRFCVDDSLNAQYLRGSPFFARLLGRTL